MIMEIPFGEKLVMAYIFQANQSSPFIEEE
jgi:hypothetical protein